VKDKTDPFENFVKTMEQAAEIIGLPEDSYSRLKSCGVI
jgi:hypothetical protein